MERAIECDECPSLYHLVVCDASNVRIFQQPVCSSKGGGTNVSDDVNRISTSALSSRTIASHDIALSYCQTSSLHCQEIAEEVM